jgi:hypothetical protein
VGTLTISDSTFSDNSSIGEFAVGAILDFGILTISDSTFSDNSGSGPSTAPGIEVGGAIINDEGALTISNSTFSDNSGNGTAGFLGGAIINGGTTLIISDSTFSDNSSNGLAFGGGADIVNAGSTITVTKSTFSNDGLGISNNDGQLSVLNSAFSGNSDAGIFNGIDGVIVTNSTFSGNNYGIENNGGLTVINSTFSGNYDGILSTFGGRVFNSSFSGNIDAAIVADDVVDLHGTLMAGESSGGNCSSLDIYPGVTFTDLGYNISADDSCGFTATGSMNNTDPMLDPAGLANNGGPTQTIALLSGSPAIDVIPLADCTDQDGNPLTTDERGFPRPDAGEGVCDIGA